MTHQGADQVLPYPKSRHFMEEAVRSTHHKPMMHGLLEVDGHHGSRLPAGGEGKDWGVP